MATIGTESYDQDDLIKRSLEAIETNRLIFIDDIPAFLPCSRATFYARGLNKLDSIKEALYSQRIMIKSSLRARWYNSSNATLQISLMKLIATPEELDKLSMVNNKVDVSSGGEPINEVFKIGDKTVTFGSAND